MTQYILFFFRRHSDDPLISGAIDDNQNEFNPIKSKKIPTASSPSLPSVISIPPATTTTTTVAATSRKKVSRTRRKGQFKLRFHHQALPQEYLDHYEATQNNLQKKEAEQIKANKAAAAANSSMEVDDQLQAARTHDSVRNWLQKISEFQNETTAVALAAANATTAANDSTATRIKQELSDPCESFAGTTATGINAKKPSRVVNYNDLPYMGEMTLDNSKPRRGRKPKKADICHLIYKNYGTILPGTPKDMMENNNKHLLDASVIVPTTVDAKKTEIQNKLIGSLLEKRLTNERTKNLVNSKDTPKIVDGKLQAEPLNLCVRDRSDTLTVSSDDEDTDSCFIESTRTSPMLASTSDTDALLAANLKMSLPNFQSALLGKPPSGASNCIQTPSDNTSPPGYVYLPDAGVFIHPMALYYQKMVDASGSTAPNTIPVPLSTSSSTPSTGGTTTTPAVSPMPPMPSPSPPFKNKEATAKILIPKNISQLLKQDKPQIISAPSETSSTSSKSTTPAPQKRKRSAIFIPPMPVESSSSHATEVSICKFKFTGGAKPSLQEKKMLSVDSGGNFRYYSGTGDKSMRGYEFFPRESLQQSSLLAGSSAGAFLNTPGEKISVDLPPPSLGISNEVLQIPELPSPTASVNTSVTSPLLQPQPLSTTPRQHRSVSSDRRKRKSRRSLQREKLEKTFKEKGFLIQTQQLESAEGATYCKFRQLRKFTRYLFRSWKDYLPGDIQGQAPSGMPAIDGLPPSMVDPALLLANQDLHKLIPPPVPPGSNNQVTSMHHASTSSTMSSSH